MGAQGSRPGLLAVAPSGLKTVTRTLPRTGGSQFLRARPLRDRQGLIHYHFFGCGASAFRSESTFFLTSTGSTFSVAATFSARSLAIRPPGSQPADTRRMVPPLPIRKLVGIVLVSNTFQLSPLLSTA